MCVLTPLNVQFFGGKGYVRESTKKEGMGDRTLHASIDERQTPHGGKWDKPKITAPLSSCMASADHHVKYVPER